MVICKRMIKLAALLVLILSLFTLCSCSTSKEKTGGNQGIDANTQNSQDSSQESSEKGRVKKCEELIDAVFEIMPDAIFDSRNGTYIYDQNSFEAFEKADKYYNSLTDEEKSQVSNIDVLEKQRPNYLALLEKVSKYKIMQEIYLASKEEFIEEIKDRLKDPSSFQEVSYFPLMPESKDYNGDFEFQATFTFSATNSFGGRLQEEWRGTVSGTYKNGRVKEIDVDIWSMG